MFIVKSVIQLKIMYCTKSETTFEFNISIFTKIIELSLK